MESPRNGFNFYKSYYDVYEGLKNNPLQQLQFIDALLKKQFYDIDPVFTDPIVELVYKSQMYNINKQIIGFKSRMKDFNIFSKINELPPQGPWQVPPEGPPQVPPQVPPQGPPQVPPQGPWQQVQVQVQVQGEVQGEGQVQVQEKGQVVNTTKEEKLQKIYKQLIEDNILPDIQILDLDVVREMLDDAIGKKIEWEENLNKSGLTSTRLYLEENNVTYDYIIDAHLKAFNLLNQNIQLCQN